MFNIFFGLLAKVGLLSATIDATNRCTFIFGQKKMPDSLRKLSNND